MKISITRLLLSALLVAASAASAVGVSEPININAEHMTINIKTGYSVYTGNVSFVQGELKLTGEKIIVHSRDSKIQEITVDGNPARYYFTDEKNNRVYAQSEHMQYLVDKNRLVMTKNAKIEQTDNIVESQRIVYDTEKQIILAGTQDGSGEDERVNVILTPGKKQ